MIHNVISVFAEENCVGTALFGEVCDACNGGGINFVLMYAVEAMIIGIGILAVIGLMVFGIQYLTAGSNSGQTAKAKGRLINMIIGLVTYVVLIAFVQFLSPGGIKGLVVTTEDKCPERIKTETDVIEPDDPGGDVDIDISGGGGGSGGGSGGDDSGGGSGGDDSGGGASGDESTKNDRLEVHFVSAGLYDDVIILRNKRGSILIDGGRMKATSLINYIKGIGLTNIDYMIGSHIEEDHVKVQRDIAKEFSVKKAFYPVQPSNCSPWCNPGGSGPLVEAQGAGLSVSIPNPGNTRFNLGDMNIYFIGTDRQTWKDEANYSSIVNLVKYGNTSFMFTGDKENICNGDNVSLLHSAAAKFGITSLKVDVYKWPHHGNSSCTNQAFLSELSPKYVIVPNDGADWSMCKGNKCQTAKSTWGSKTEWLAMKSYKYVVFVSDGKTVTTEFNREPSYWADYWK